MLKRLLFAVLMTLAFAAQATVYSLPWGPKPQFVDANGAPMSAGTLSTFVATTTTPQLTYTDSTGGVANPTTITLNVRGETPNEVWLSAGLAYKVVLKDSSGVTVWTVDNISGVNDVSAQVGNEWVASTLIPSFVSVTSFTVSGDQTPVFTVGRRLKTTNTSGTVYSTVTASAFGAVTTVTVANDSTTLDAGLSAVSYGVLNPANPSAAADAIARKGTAVVSAATTNIWGITGDYVHVTGTATITSLGTAPYAGSQRTVIFDGALTLTHNGTTLVLPGALNIQTAANDRMIVRADTTANMIVIAYEKASGTPIGTSIPRSYLAGCTLSTAGGSATMAIAACQSTDSTNAVVMNLASSINKTTGAFVVGTGNGCLDTGAIATSTWYHFYEIYRSDTGVVEILCSTSASAPTMPTSYSFKRRIGSGKTDGASQWTAFTQDGDYFRWSAGPAVDVNTTNPGTSAVTSTLGSVPTGVNVHAMINVAGIRGTGVDPVLYVSDLAANDEAPGSTNTPLNNFSLDNGSAASFSGSQMTIRTNTSAQIRYRLSASAADTVVRVVSIGWIDRRGRDN